MEEIKNIEAEKPFAFEVEGAPHIAVPENFSVQLAEEVLPKPVRDRRRVCLVDVDSFSQYLQIHKTDRAAVHVNAVWPNENNSRPLAVGFCDDGNAQTTSWRDHEVELCPIISKDFEDGRIKIVFLRKVASKEEDGSKKDMAEFREIVVPAWMFTQITSEAALKLGFEALENKATKDDTPSSK